MTLESPPSPTDFLVAEESAERSPDIASLSFTNRALLGILRTLKKTHPSQRCVIDLQFSNPQRILDAQGDRVTVRFLAQGKPVLAEYLVVSNNTGSIINIGLNEPVVNNAAGTFANGVRLAAGGTFQIPVELEFISIGIDVAGGAGPLGIVCQNGNAGAGIPVNGTIQIYGWTIPSSDEDDTN